MPDTVVGLFRNRVEADRALGKLKDAGFGLDQLAVSTPHRRQGHYGLKILIGVGVGVVLGALVGAVVTGMVPGIHAVVIGNKVGLLLFVAFAGAITGGVAGGLLSMADPGDQALYYEQEVESGRTLVSVAGPRLAEAREIMRAAGAMEAAAADAPLERPRPEGG